MKKLIIPEKLFIASQPIKTTTMLDGSSIDVAPSYAVPENRPNRHKTARTWAGKDGVEAIEENIGLTITIIGLEVRSQGGRAYKVVDQFNRQYDLREDNLLEFLADGFIMQGRLNGEFIWAVNGSQMNLVLKDGDRHKVGKLLTAQKPIKSSAMEAGKVYLEPYYSNNYSAIFYLGEIAGIKYKIRLPKLNNPTPILPLQIRGFDVSKSMYTEPSSNDKHQGTDYAYAKPALISEHEPYGDPDVYDISSESNFYNLIPQIDTKVIHQLIADMYSDLVRVHSFHAEIERKYAKAYNNPYHTSRAKAREDSVNQYKAKLQRIQRLINR